MRFSNRGRLLLHLQTGRDRFSVLEADSWNKLHHERLQIWSNLNQASALRRINRWEWLEIPLCGGEKCSPTIQTCYHRTLVSFWVSTSVVLWRDWQFIQPSIYYSFVAIHVGINDTSRGDPEHIKSDERLLHQGCRWKALWPRLCLLDPAGEGKGWEGTGTSSKIWTGSLAGVTGITLALMTTRPSSKSTNFWEEVGYTWKSEAKASLLTVWPNWWGGLSTVSAGGWW